MWIIYIAHVTLCRLCCHYNEFRSSHCRSRFGMPGVVAHTCKNCMVPETVPPQKYYPSAQLPTTDCPSSYRDLCSFSTVNTPQLAVCP